MSMLKFNDYSLELKVGPFTIESYQFLRDHFSLGPYESFTSGNIYQVTASYEGKLVGVKVFNLKDHKIHLNYTLVSPAYQNRGLNKRMFSLLLDFAKQSQVEVITANVRASNIYSIKSLLSSGFQLNDRVSLSYPDGEKKLPFFFRF